MSRLHVVCIVQVTGHDKHNNPFLR